MTPQAAQLAAAIEQEPLTAGEIWQRYGIARAAARVHELRAELPNQGKTVSTDLVQVLNRQRKPVRVARYAIVALQAQGDLFVPVQPGAPQ